MAEGLAEDRLALNLKMVNCLLHKHLQNVNSSAMSKTRKHKEIQGIPAMAETKNHSKDIESGAPIWYHYAANKS